MRFPALIPLTSVCLAAALFGQGSQSVGVVQAKTPTQPFASPWNVSFKHIQSAMSGSLGGLAVEQVRRRRSPTGFDGVLESLWYQPSAVGGDFLLRFIGIEGRTLSASAFASEAARFERRAGFQFRYGSFRVDDAAQAANVYDLVFLSHASRVLQSGQRPVYRMAVLPKQWDRAAWLVDLDLQTGYPLYSGEYDLHAPAGPTLMSELVVTSFRIGMRFPLSTTWWSPNMDVASMPDEVTALQKALPATLPVPTGADVPSSYTLMRSEVHTDLFTAGKAAVFTYSDGIDHLFVRQTGILVVPRPADDSISFFDRDGVTQCMFSHRGVEFMVIGRSTDGAVRRTSEQIYRRAIQTLK